MSTVTCKVCTLENDSSSKICEVCGTPLQDMDADGKELLTRAMMSDDTAEATADFVDELAELLDVSIMLVVLHGKYHQAITTDGNVHLILRHTGHLYGHYILVFQGKELDMGQYNTRPRGLTGKLLDDYNNILKKHGWTKKCNNCCLPMCIIIGVLLTRHYQENPSSLILQDLCAEQERLLKEEKKQEDASMQLAMELQREEEDAEFARQLQAQFDWEDNEAAAAAAGEEEEDEKDRELAMELQQEQINATAARLGTHLGQAKQEWEPYKGKMDSNEARYDLLKNLGDDDVKKGAILLYTNRFGPFVVKWVLKESAWVVAHHTFGSKPTDFKVDRDKSYHLYFTIQDSRVFFRRR